MNRSQEKSAFTLVELLVVIGIISMLIALLLPAVLSGQEQARQAKCQKQMKELGSAALQYTLRKGRFPGYAHTETISDGAGGTQPIVLGWVPQLFDYLDMQERTRRLREWEMIGGELTYLEYLDLLVCPSDPPDLEAPFWSEDDCGSTSDPPTIPYPTSYAVNTGRQDDYNANSPDEARFAVFHDRRAGVSKTVTVTLEDLTDGKRETLIISENVDLVSWTQPYGSTVLESHQGLVYADGTRLATQAPLNGDLIAPFDCDKDGLADNLDYAHARPSSFHQEGFNVAYADGSTDFFFVDGGSDLVYAAKMTPANSD